MTATAERTGTRLPGPKTLFGITAGAEMVTWALLITALILRATGVTDAMVRPAGGIHGFVFLCYVAVSVAVWVDQRWPASRGIAAVATAVVPFLTVPFERHLARKGVPEPTWRLADPRAERRGPLEPVLAWVLRHPVLAVVLALVLIAAVFTALLNAGPPTEWFS